MSKLRGSGAVLVSLVTASLALTACVGGGSTSTNAKRNSSAKTVSLTISANSVIGGKSDNNAEWIVHYVIPGFEKAEKAKGVNVSVRFLGSGVEDADFLTKLELGLRTNSAADISSADGIWLGQLAAAGFIKPLSTVVGPSVNDWSGWSQISSTVKSNMEVNGQVYGIPSGTDGRVIYFNKTLFQKAGLPTNWQPKSWADVLAAGRTLKQKLPGVTPIQLDAGVPMGEATTTQGFLPILAGTSDPALYDASTKKWQGATASTVAALNFYKQIYGSGLGDPKLQEDENGREESFTEFSQNKIGILFESDYLWRSIICPQKSICAATSMPNRNSVVGFALIPNQNGGKYVSVSGGGGWIMNPNTKYPQQAWALLEYMNSEAAVLAGTKNEIAITARNDVNQQELKDDPLLSFIADKVLPITRYRPSNANYNQVSSAIQQATADVVAGKSPTQAAQTYQSSLQKIVGSGSVTTG